MSSTSDVAPDPLRSDATPAFQSASELSDDALLSGPSSAASDSLRSAAAATHNGFAQGHAHLQHPNLSLSGLSHIETFLPAASPSSATDPLTHPTPVSPTSSSLLGFSAGSGSSDGQSSAPSSPAGAAHAAGATTISPSPSIGSLSAATFAGPGTAAALTSPMSLPSPTPQTPITPTGYAATNLVPSGPNTQPNGHPNFFPQRAHTHASAGPNSSNSMQLQPIQPAYPPQPNVHPYVPPPYSTANQHAQPPLPQQPPQPHQQPPHLQQYQQQQQQQQRAAPSAVGAKSGFFSRLMNSREQPAPKPIERPLPVYMQRLRRTHDYHFNNLNKLREVRAAHEKKRNEEIAQWQAWALHPLAAIAAAYYAKNLQHLTTLLELEGRYMDNVIEHVTVVNAVVEGKLSEAVIAREMLSAVGDGSVKAQEEVDAMFWPPSAEEVKANCKRLYEEAERLRVQYMDMQTRMKKRETVEVRRRKLQEWLIRGLVHKDTVAADEFHHHPFDPRVQLPFNNLMMDQRGDEGKLMRRFLDMQTTHKDRMTPPAIQHFIGVMIGQVLKSYSLDEKTVGILRVYIDRLVFPRIPEAMSALITAEEREESRQLAAKLPWLRTLTPKQLNMDEELVPPGYMHDGNYQPLYTPAGAVEAAAAPAPTAAADATAAPWTAPHPQTQAPPQMQAQDGHTDDGMQPKRMVPDTFPYADAINTLTLLNDDTVPADIFFHVVQSVRLVFQTAKVYTRQNREARARATSRALTYSDPFAKFMTKLVEDSGKEAEELERKDAEEKERKAQEAAKEAEARRAAAALAVASVVPGSAPKAAVASDPLAELNPLNPLAPPPPAAAATTNAAGASLAPATAPTSPQKVDHPLAPHHLSPSTAFAAAAVDAAPHTSPAPIPSLPVPPAPIPERPAEDVVINADMLLPLMPWLVVHAQVPQLQSKMGQAKRFIAKELFEIGEAAYCYQQVEGAVYWLQQLNEDNLGQGGQQPPHQQEEEKERPQSQRSGVVLSSPGLQSPEADRVSSPAMNLHSPSNNMLSPNTGAPNLTSSVSLDDGLRRRETKEDVFEDLLQRPTNAEAPPLPPLSPG